MIAGGCGQQTGREGGSSASDVGENTRSPGLLPPEDPPTEWRDEFSTDFSRRTVSYSDIISGGPRKDGIPAIDKPASRSLSEVPADFLPLDVPLLVVSAGGEARGYPVGVLMRHEIVNDTLGGIPIVATYCPLCNSGLAFDRRFEGKRLDFGTTGRLRMSNLVMYDRQTESWWQQGTGDAIAGEYAGGTLDRFAATLLSWRQFRAGWPEGSVLLPPGGDMRRYRANPYSAYDNPETTRPFLYDGEEIDSRLPAMARVIGLLHGESAIAFPYALLRQERLIEAELGDRSILLLWDSGVASALDHDLIEQGRDVGGAIAYNRHLGDTTLSFTLDSEGKIRDRQSGTVWNHAGRAVDGPRRGERLRQIVAWNYLWFSWSAFYPESAIYQTVD